MKPTIRRRLLASGAAALLSAAMLIPQSSATEPVEVSPADTNEDFDKVPLITENLSDPFEIAVTPEREVIYVERTGKVKVLDQTTLQSTVALDLEYTLEHTEQSDGLLGLTLDNDFAENRWIYLYYSDKDEAKLNLSRFTLGEDNVIDPASEARLLEVPSFRDEGRANSHMGGGLAMGPDGDLYVGTGDNSDPFQQDGFTPIDEREGRAAYDAQGTAGNTNDLRGKILRITPEDDGTYSIPEENLFAPDAEGTMPEIYVMGQRNPFRISVDHETNVLYVGDYGPDATEADPERGPAGEVEYQRITEASNQGWPYCMGYNKPFIDYDFATGESGEAFDCGNLVNDSPNNTGLTELPPAQPATIAYGYGVSEEWPELEEGGAAPMSGPVYRHDPEVDTKTAFPESFDGQWFVYEYARRYFKTIEFDDAGEPAAINDFLDEETFVAPFDAEFGPDGSMYIIEFGEGSGSGRGGSNEGAGIYRIDYVADGRPPEVQVSATQTSGPAPLEVEFDSEGSGSPEGLDVTYAWDFDGDGEVDSSEENPTHNYTEPGQYLATLTLTDSDGETGVRGVTITAGNTAPEVEFATPPHGGFFEFGDVVPYDFTVDDPEDGSSASDDIDCERVSVSSQLGHDQHQHPFENYTGCTGEVQTDVAGHGEGQNLYWQLVGAYQDEGAEGVPELSTEQRVVLQPRNVEAEHFDDTSGPTVVDNEDARAGSQAGEFTDGDWVSYEPVEFTGIDSLTLGVAPGTHGGTVEVRRDAPDGPLLGEVDIDGGGDLTQVVSPTIDIDTDSGTTAIYLVVRGEAELGDGESLMAIDWLVYNGRGIADDTAPVVTAEATQDEGDPAQVTFTGSAEAPGDREIDSHQWYFGDGNTAEGAEATHTYPDSGEFTARLVATDSEGAHDWATVEVAVQPQEPDECPYGFGPEYTVYFGSDAASGVPNYDVGNGCTVMDLINEQAPFANHGEFVSTASRVTNELRQDDVLSAVEQARIIRAAAASDVGRQQRGDGDREVPFDQVGLVLFTTRDEMSADPEATLDALATCGFQNAEPSGSVGDFYGMSAAELAPMAEDSGLNVPSLGVSYDDILNDLDGVIDEAHVIGASYVRISGSDSWGAADYSEVAANLNDAGAQLDEAGITMAYHNHGYELEELGEGVTGYDILVRETNPELVTMELDVYWAASVGTEAVELFQQYPGRFELLHLKDIDENGDFADVGEGTIDFGEIFAHSELAGTEYFLTEHDDPSPDGITSACNSLSNLGEIRF